MNLLESVKVLASSESVESLVETTAETLAEGGSQGWGAMFGEMIENANPMRFVENLPYMGVGMLGIFLVMGILIIGTAVLNKVTNRKPKDKEN